MPSDSDAHHVWEHMRYYLNNGTLVRMPLIGDVQIPPNCEDARKFKFDLTHRDTQYHCDKRISDQVLRCMAPAWVLQLEAGFLGWRICSLNTDYPQHLLRYEELQGLRA